MWLRLSWPWLPWRLICWVRGHQWRSFEYWIRCDRCYAFKHHPQKYWDEYEAWYAQWDEEV